MKARLAGGDGSTQANAVVVFAEDEHSGVRAEYAWTARTHPTWRKEEQALIRGTDKHLYDRIIFQAPDGRHEAWFEISSFFGKQRAIPPR